MMLICDVRIVDVLGIKLNLLFKNKGKENVIIWFDEENEYCSILCICIII